MKRDVKVTGGGAPVDLLRDQLLLIVRRLRQEALTGSEPWSRLALLAAIDRLGKEASPTALAKELDLRSSNVAAGLRDAEERGYLDREFDKDDRRKVRLALTPAGKSVLEEAREQRSKWFNTVIAERLTKEEKKILFIAGELLARLARAPRVSRPAQ